MTESEAAQSRSLDHASLVPWLRSHVPGTAGDIVTEKFAGGQSNPTYRIAVDGVPKFVLRKKPEGPILPSAHAVEREYTVTAALMGTAVPVAQPLALCEDPAILGTPFFIMRYVAGRNFWDATLPDLSPDERRAVHIEMIRVLAELHRIDPAAVGLADFGRPGDYFARQVARWTRQYRAAQTRSIEAIERLIEWLPRHNPELLETRIVHGDFRNDNLIFASEAPRVAAVLDWELSTLGHPLADLAQHLLAWRLNADYRGIAEADRRTLGIPEEAELLVLYAQLSGREPIDPDHWRFSLTFAAFRNACIRQGVFKRAQDGNASSPHALEHGARAEAVGELAWRLASGEQHATVATRAGQANIRVG